MDKTPFLAGVQQELFFLPAAARHLANSGATGPDAIDMLEAAIEKEAVRDEHLEGLGLLGAPETDAAGYPARPPRHVTVRAMAEDCLDQMQHLGLFDERGRITEARLAQIEDKAWLRDAVLKEYRVRGKDGRRRNVIGVLNNTFEELTAEPPEREDNPSSAAYRRGLCLAEFMRLHFWMADMERTLRDDGLTRLPYSWEFAHELLADREEALNGLDVGEGGIEYAALVMADAAAEWLLDNKKEAEDKIPAARSTVLMLCDAGIIVPHGFPGGIQWLHPVADLENRPRRRRRRERQTGQGESGNDADGAG